MDMILIHSQIYPLPIYFMLFITPLHCALREHTLGWAENANA
jgi:hypothetical protein